MKENTLSVRLVSSLFALFFSVGLLVVGNGFLMTLLGIRLSLDEVDPRLIGGVMVSYSIGFVLGSLYSTIVIQRVGHIRAFAVFCAVLAIASLIYPMIDNFPTWIGLRIIGGFAMAGLLIVAESWFSAIATNENRSTIFSLYQICFYMATSIAQLLVTLGQPGNYFLFSLVAAILIAAIIPLSLTRMQAPNLESVERLSLAKVFAVSPLGLISTLVSGVIISSFYGLGPLFANLIGFTVDQTAWFMSASVFTAMLFAWPIGRLCDRVDRVKILLYLGILSAGFSLILSFNIPSFWLVVIANGAFIAFVAAIYPVGVALMNDRIEHSQMISASATLLLSFGVGSCIGPVISSSLMELFGAGGMYMGNTILLLTLCAYTLHRLGKGLTVDVEDQEPFVTLMPEASPVINELNPLNEHFEEVPLGDIQFVEPKP
ncbi:MAG: MFS family permease [Oleiphilaceae bacterium]